MTTRATPATRATLGFGSVEREQAVAAIAQLVLLTSLSATVGLSTTGWVAGIGYTAGLLALVARAARRSRTSSLGPADHVTLARAVLIGGVVALISEHPDAGMPVVIFVTIAAVALSLDAVDGQVARRTGTSSPLGARFDMEVDAFLILALSAYAALSLGAWVLTIGIMRYAFVALGRFMPWLRAPLSPSYARKVVAAVQGIVLLVAASGVAPLAVEFAVTALALAALVWSFGRDTVRLWLNHRMIDMKDTRSPQALHR